MSKLKNDILNLFKQINEWESTLYRYCEDEKLFTNAQERIPKEENLVIEKLKSIPSKLTTSVTLDLFQYDESYESLSQWKTLSELYQNTKNCQKCSLGGLRTNFVFGDGSEKAKLVFIGEAPGEDEDLTGIPFVGRAGKLLTKIFSEAGIPRDQVYICNVLKCRPPKNRDPLPEEVTKCQPYLKKQIEILNPKMLVALGRIAAQLLLNTNESLTKLKKSVHKYCDIPLFVTYHPAYILRNLNAYSEALEDMVKIKQHYYALGGTFD